MEQSLRPLSDVLMIAHSSFNKRFSDIKKVQTWWVESLILGTIWSYAENPSIFSKIVLGLVLMLLLCIENFKY